MIAFNAQDLHNTAESKRAYNSKIRKFLAYLEDNGIISNRFLHLSVPTATAPKVRVVTTLEVDSVNAFWSLNQDKLSPIERRDYAITCIGLGMGLRGVDIVKLHFKDIDWTESIISLSQQKTATPIKLPMPAHVGNAIYRYFTVRPKNDNDYVFVNLKAPYAPLTRSVCLKAIRRFFPKATGFHDSRRTFATNLLRGNVKQDIIKDSLGHTTNQSIAKYLSLDEDRIRQCALQMDSISITMEGDFYG